MKRILFVDDEQDILDALQDSLRKQIRRWDMTFVCGGEAAIAELLSNEFDVVVSDIRMPVVDGVGVLQYTKEQYPQTIRIALTGYSNRESTVQLTSLAQRYLTKPCNIDELEEAISRDSGLIEAFDNDAVKALAGSAGRLPGSDSKQQALMDLLNGSDGSIDDIASIVEEDIALTAKILQLANSSFFRRQTSVESAKQAVAYLGVDVIRSLVLANQLFEMTQALPPSQYFNATSIHHHSKLTGTIAKEITTKPELSTTAFTAGLLHDVGKIIIAIEKPDLLAALMNASAGAPYTWVDSSREREILGCTHAEIGGYFLDLWGIPTAVVEAVTFHDTPTSVFSREFDAVGAVHAANYLAHWAVQTDESKVIENKLDREYLLNLDVLDLEPEWKEQALDIANESNDAPGQAKSDDGGLEDAA
ncbi:MAG: HDOD domain-containing protein [Granulosicoccus sp.]